MVNQPTDIDTQIEEKDVRAIFVKHSMEKGEDLELFDTDAIITELTKAIKTLLIQSIDDALANQATPTASGKQVAKPSEEA